MPKNNDKKSLKDTQARYKAILEGTNAGTWEWNIQTGETIFNDRWAQIIGYTLKELEPTNIDTWMKYTLPEDLTRCQEKLESHIRGDTDDYECECRMKHKDGHYIWILDRGTVMEWTEDGKPLWMFGTHIDITKLKEAQYKLKRQRNILHERNKELSCLFKMSEIVQNKNQNLEEMIQQFVDIVPPAFQNPLLTWAKISFKGKVYQSENFRKTRDTISSDILFQGKKVGLLEVFMIKEELDEKTSSFLENEIRLIHSLSERISQIAEHKALDTEVIEREQKFRTLFETMAQGIVYHKKTGEIIDANPAAERILGLSISQMQGRTSTNPAWHCIHEDGSPFPGQEHPAMVALQTGQPVYGKIMGVFNPSEEKYHWIKVNAIPQYRQGEEEQPYQVYASFEDITNEFEAQRKAQESEKSLYEVYDAIQDGISVLDSDMHIIQYNKWIAKTHKGEKSLLNRKCYEAYQNRDSPCPQCPVIECLASGHIQTKEIKITLKNGKHLWTETSAYPITDETGQVIKIIEYVKNITERKQAEWELEKFKRISDNALNGTCITNIQGKILYCNDYLAGIHGYTAKDVMGENVTLFHTHEQMQQIKEQIRHLLKSKGNFPAMEIWHRHKSGHDFPMLMSGILLKNETGEDPFIAISAVNISEQKELEFTLKEQKEELKASNEEMEALNEELMESVEEARKANQVKSDFLANMSHELRTPLNGVLGFGEILKNTPLSDEQLRYLDVVLTSANNLLEIIKDILDFSRLEARTFQLRPEKTDLSTLVDKTLSVIRYSVDKKGLDLFVDIDETVPQTVIVDGSRLRQILLNLLSNAVKFTDQGEIRFKLKELERQNGTSRLLFEVTDTGIGIKEEDFEKIFEPFLQVDMSSTREYGGTGLGLAIVNDLLEKMGSSLQLESTYGKGSTFSFELLLPCEKKQSLDSDKADHTITTDTPSFKNKKILIAEDNLINMNYAQTALAVFSKDLQILQAKNGKEAYQQYREHKPELILMDVVMPEMNGYQATKMIRQHDTQVPIIAMTAKAYKEDKDTCLASGMTDYITKPVSLEQLKVLLKKYL